MGTLNTWNFDGSNGAVVTDTGLAKVGTGTLLYSTADTARGTSGARATANDASTCAARLTTSVSSLTMAWGGFLKTFAAPPGAVSTLSTLRYSTGNALKLQESTDGSLGWSDIGGLYRQIVAAASVAASTFYYWDVTCVVGTSTTTGSVTVTVYNSAGTQLGTNTFTTANIGTTAITASDVGPTTPATPGLSVGFDYIRMENDRATPFGFPTAGTANTAPTVTAGATQTIAAGTSVTFSFSASDDVAVTSLTGAVTGPATVALSGAASGTSSSASRTYAPTGMFTTPGVYTVTATATDGSGATGTASTTVYVYAASGTYADPASVSGAWANVGGASSALAAISDTNPATYLESGPGTALFVTLAPTGPGAVTIGVEGYWFNGAVSRTLTLYKADGTTQIDTLPAYDITSTNNEKSWAVSTTQTNTLIPAATDRQALILKIQDA